MKLSDKVLLGLGAGLALLALAMLAAPFLPPVETPRMKLVELVIGICSAIGTTLAVVVALYVGFLPLKEARKRSQFEAAVVAACIRVDVNRIAAFALSVDRILDESDAEISGANWDRLRGAINDPLFANVGFLGHETLLRTAALPNVLAMKLANGQSQIQFVHSLVQNVGDRWGSIGSDKKKRAKRVMALNAKAAAKQLTEVRDALKKTDELAGAEVPVVQLD